MNSIDPQVELCLAVILEDTEQIKKMDTNLFVYRMMEDDVRTIHKLITARQLRYNLTRCTGYSAFHIACLAGKVKSVETIISKAKEHNVYRNTLLQTNEGKQNAIFLATNVTKEIDCLKILCKAVADWTDISWATRNGIYLNSSDPMRLEILEYLCSNQKIKDDDLERMRLILNVTPENRAYQQAIEIHLNIPQVLLSIVQEYYGVYCPETLNAQKIKAISPLGHASYNCLSDKISLLLNAGADPLAKTLDPSGGLKNVFRSVYCFAIKNFQTTKAFINCLSKETVSQKQYHAEGLWSRFWLEELDKGDNHLEAVMCAAIGDNFRLKELIAEGIKLEDCIAPSKSKVNLFPPMNCETNDSILSVAIRNQKEEIFDELTKHITPELLFQRNIMYQNSFDAACANDQISPRYLEKLISALRPHLKEHVTLTYDSSTYKLLASHPQINQTTIDKLQMIVKVSSEFQIRKIKESLVWMIDDISKIILEYIGDFCEFASNELNIYPIKTLITNRNPQDDTYRLQMMRIFLNSGMRVGDALDSNDVPDEYRKLIVSRAYQF